MSLSSKSRTVTIRCLGIVIAGTIAATAWLLKPAWDAHRERVAFEAAARELDLTNAATVEKLSALAHRTGLPDSAAAVIEKDGGILVPFYLRSCWYCLHRGPADLTDKLLDNVIPKVRLTRLFRLEIPVENYVPQTERARQAVSRAGQVEQRESRNGFVEEPALPLQGEEARSVAFMFDFYEQLAGRADRQLNLHYTLIHSEPDH